MSALERMSAVTRGWFGESFAGPTRVQELGWSKIADGAHTLMLAPTGSGKTLAAFLWCVDRIASPRERPMGGYRALYVSPLKALAYDVERNLHVPVAGMARVAERLGAPPPIVQIDVRTGDTSMQDRRRQARRPGDILITTPESLYLLLGSQARAALTSIETVIIDEIHALAPTKRGVHLALSMERLSHLITSTGRPEPQRIGLSATQRPLDTVARYLGGDRAVEIVDTGERPELDLQVVVPVADMAAAGERAAPIRRDTSGRTSGRAAARGRRAAGADPVSAAAGVGDEVGLPPSERNSLWPAIYPRLLELILAHRSTIVFVNSRRLAERLAQALSELAAAQGVDTGGVDLVRAHHGSVARHEREHIEAALKAGQLRAITATSSLELGIDMGAVDLVVQLESPGAVARGLQRIGRANHHLGGAPKGRIVPKFRGDLLEIAAVTAAMRRGEVEPIALPENCLDVLAQQLVAMCATEPWPLDALEHVVRRAASYRGLTHGALVAVLDMLSGRYPSDDFAELRPRLTWDRHRDVLTARRGARMIAVVNGGTIADRGLYAVHLGARGPRIGELDEEMVYESRAGETFILGASTWRIEEITRDQVIVSPAPGEPGKMPFWRGDRPGRPVELGRAVGALCARIDDAIVHPGGATATARDGARAPTRALDELRAELTGVHALDDHAASNLIAYVADQRVATGTVPSDRAITVERFRDELGDWRVCILSPLGARVHAPWALVLQRQLEDRLGYPIHPMTTDDGIALRFADAETLPSDRDLFPDPDEVEHILVDELSRAAVFAGHFRENAGRALLLPRRRPGQRTPLWSQRLRAQQLLGVALRYPSFPIVLETFRECLRDVFDVPALVETLRQVQSRQIRIDSATTEKPSPFARSLAFDYVAAYLYEGDAPLAERRAAALALDRSLLRELLGEGELRALLDPEVMLELEHQLQGRAEDRRARDPDDLHDLLLRLGDLAPEELGERFDGPAPALASALAQLTAQGRVATIRLGGQPRWIAVEDAARYRDALGAVLPPELPSALLAPALAPTAATAAIAAALATTPAAAPETGLDELVIGLAARYARGHGPFTAAELAARFRLPMLTIERALAALVARGTLIAGEFRVGVSGRELCDAEVLRRIRRGTLARARDQIAAVPAARYAQFLTSWHGLGEPRSGLAALRDAVARLEGLALPFSELESRILPARVADYSPRMLDELGAIGEVVWIGRGSLGASDGRVVLCRRAHATALLGGAGMREARPDGSEELASGEPHRSILEHLERAGASFLVAIEAAIAAAVPAPADGSGRSAAVRAALWELVWAGLITNDTLAPLRSLGAPTRRRSSPGSSFGGRWSLVRQLTGEPASGAPAVLSPFTTSASTSSSTSASTSAAAAATSRAHLRAVAMLDRWGVVSRQAAIVEELPGGLAAVIEVLRAMDDAGKLRRGFFVDGLAGTQYAWPGAIDRLRAPLRASMIARPEAVDGADSHPASGVLALSAVDPANPWGSLLPWPESAANAPRPMRRAGAIVVLVDGACALHVEPRGKRLLTFPEVGEPALERALRHGLPQVAHLSRRRSLTLEHLDGQPALSSPLASRLEHLGARRDYRGVVLTSADS